MNGLPDDVSEGSPKGLQNRSIALSRVSWYLFAASAGFDALVSDFAEVPWSLPGARPLGPATPEIPLIASISARNAPPCFIRHSTCRRRCDGREPAEWAGDYVRKRLVARYFTSYLMFGWDSDQN